ncbi:hypothetical protein Tco_1150571, partial [Tanacetum coccineum]
HVARQANKEGQEMEASVWNLVASPFTKLIRDYDMSDWLKGLLVKVQKRKPAYDRLLRRNDDWGIHQWITIRRLFKDLIACPPASMEDLFTQAHNFMKADEANTENRLRDSRWATND